jgi:hypothetical protein
MMPPKISAVEVKPIPPVPVRRMAVSSAGAPAPEVCSVETSPLERLAEVFRRPDAVQIPEEGASWGANELEVDVTIKSGTGPDDLLADNVTLTEFAESYDDSASSKLLGLAAVSDSKVGLQSGYLSSLRDHLLDKVIAPAHRDELETLLSDDELRFSQFTRITFIDGGAEVVGFELIAIGNDWGFGEVADSLVLELRYMDI